MDLPFALLAHLPFSPSAALLFPPLQSYVIRLASFVALQEASPTLFKPLISILW